MNRDHFQQRSQDQQLEVAIESMELTDFEDSAGEILDLSNETGRLRRYRVEKNWLEHAVQLTLVVNVY